MTSDDVTRAMRAAQHIIIASHNPHEVPTECPLCGEALIPEHAHFACRGPNGCGWRDSCCD